MVVHRVESLEAHRRHRDRIREEIRERRSLGRELSAPHRAERRPFVVPGFSYPAGRMVNFGVSWPAAEGEEPNWRESLTCPVTGLNSRLRACWFLLDARGELYPDASIYLTEQVTPFFRLLRQRCPRTTGSEFLGPGNRPGSVDSRGIRHEDLTALSFADATFDAVLSFECFEHIPDFVAALGEVYRVLRPGGCLLATVPFVSALHPNTIRARISPGGGIEHLLPPEYHGDPLRADGSLCFTHFGWEFLDDLRSAGFVDVHALAVWSRLFGHLGEEIIAFMARRPN